MFFAILLVAIASPAAGERTVDVLEDGQWVEREVTTLRDVQGFRRQRVTLNEYGGWASGPLVEATGFFRTQQVDGRWWLVDPSGRLFLSVGLCSVHPDRADVGDTDLGSLPDWAEATSRLLRGNGFNTLGCWSDWRPFVGEHRMPYTRRWNFMATFARKLGLAESGFGHAKFKNNCMPIFHPDFAAFCDEHAKQLAETKDDPWLIGHFSDNELPFRPNLLDLFLELPEDDHGYKAAKAWWDDRRKETGEATRDVPTTADQDAFLTFVADKYYQTVGDAIRRYDPNHLFLGSRVHGLTIRPATFRGSSAVDVVSVNYYHRWTPEPERIAEWAEASGRPVLVSEWYAMALPDADPKVRGAGFRVRSHPERGLFYQNFTLGLLAHPDCVGWHWFKYTNDNERRNIGIVSDEYRPYIDVLSVMRQLNDQVYPLAEHFQKSKQ